MEDNFLSFSNGILLLCKVYLVSNDLKGEVTRVGILDQADTAKHKSFIYLTFFTMVFKNIIGSF